MNIIKYGDIDYGQIQCNEYNEPIYDKNLFCCVTVKDLQIGEHMIIKGNVVKILQKSTSHPGKHGHPKCYFKCIGVFDNKTREDIIPSTHLILKPILLYDIYDFVSKSDKEVELFDSETNMLITIKIIPEIDNKIIQEIDKNIHKNKNNNEYVLHVEVVKFEYLIRILKIIW